MKKAIILLLVICLVSVSACIPGNVVERIGAPLGDVALTSIEYNIIMGREGTAIMNLLETHMSNGRSVARGEYPLDREIGNVAYSIAKADEAITAVAILHIPEGMEDTAAEMIRRMHNARNSLELYQTDLLNNNLEAIGGRVNLMRGDFTALSGMQNP